MKPYRRVKSFVRRERKLKYPDNFKRLWSTYGIDTPETVLDFNTLFQKEGVLVLEIGFGTGASLFQEAHNNPEINYLGIEVYRNGILHLLRQLEKESLSNLKVLEGDANEILSKNVSDQSLDRIQIYFPDPWPKNRHHKRRLIQKDFIQLVIEKLKPEGQLYLATDWENYATHMMQLLESFNQWENNSGRYQFSPTYPSRAVTKFEKRGLKCGHSIWNLSFKKKTI